MQQYLARGPLDRNAIHSVNGGGNDFFFQLSLLAAGAANPAQVQAALGTAAVQLGTQVAILNAAGARYVVIWNVPDLGLTPFAQASGLASSVSALGSFFNTTLQATPTPRAGNPSG